VTALDIVTLVVAILGIVLAASSLAWQAATFVPKEVIRFGP
jgi:hypothetical protein